MYAFTRLATVGAKLMRLKCVRHLIGGTTTGIFTFTDNDALSWLGCCGFSVDTRLSIKLHIFLLTLGRL